MNQINSSDTIVIKKLLPSDWQKYRDLRLESLQNDPKAFEGTSEYESKQDAEYWKERCYSPVHIAYAADNGNFFIAIAGLEKISEDNWMLDAVYTLPKYRHCKTAEKLINHLIDEAKSIGVNSVSLTVNPQQKYAVKLYKKLGFKKVNKTINLKMGDGNKYDMIYMERKV